MFDDLDMDDGGELLAVAIILQILVVCWKPVLAIVTALIIAAACAFAYYTPEPKMIYYQHGSEISAPRTTN